MAKKDAVGGSGKGFQGTKGACYDMKLPVQDASRVLKGPSVNTGAVQKDYKNYQKPLGPRTA